MNFQVFRRLVAGAFGGGALLVVASIAAADSGAVEQLSGTLSVKGADGKVRILARKSEIRPGDTLNTERDSYAQVKFADGGRVTLKPNTTVRLDAFKFSQQKPQEDSFAVSLLRGGMRAVTGAVGKRNRENYKVETATATVGIRGTTFSVDDCATDRGSPDCARLEPAVYVGVSDGEVVVRNAEGELGIAAGRFGMIEKNKRPLFLSTDPGLNITPPASFFASLAGGATLNAGKTMECVVGN